MPYLPDLNTYLHQSSLLIQAYPTTTRITTKYSLPRRTNPKSKSNVKPAPPESATTEAVARPHRERLPPSATLTLKTFEPGSGICLKYTTDKAAEVGRLLTGLGRLAGGEVIEIPVPSSAPVVAPAEDKMEVDEVGSGAATPKVEDGKVQGPAQGQPQAQGGSGKGKKKKGKK
jgi:hypothetical protein